MLTNLLKDPTSLLKNPELLTSVLQMAVPGLQSVAALTDVLKKVPFLKDLPLMQDLSSIIENPGKLLTDPKALTGLLKTVPGLESLANLPDLLGGLGKLPGISELGNLFKKIGENEDAKHCEEGWKYARETTFCYFYKESDEKLFFSAAESECQGKQSHLASVHSEEEMKFLQDLAKTKNCGKPESFAWIGLKVLDGKRVWADGSEDDFVRSDSMNDLANYGICSGENPSDYPIHPLPKSDEQQQSRYICKKRSKDNE
ncbi:unnamed protein product, partial [Mesorhabditis belari]|uniref:C-type lectin domain-containing protein n=1 Tax=Mesorhabditis belari TaxID=2138241 RepID=A0AAF3EKV5_9BILA